MPIDFIQYNKGVTQWADDVKHLFKSYAISAGIYHRPNSDSPRPSINQFKRKLTQQDGSINKITYQFPRNLIWTHKGAGKGRGGVSGSKWVDKYGNKKKTNPNSFGKMGTDGRTAKPFINDVLDSDKGVNKLATIVAEELGDALIGSLLIQ